MSSRRKIWEQAGVEPVWRRGNGRGENLLVAVEGVDDELHHPVHLRLELELLGLVSQLLHLGHAQAVQLYRLLLPSNPRIG